ncbi:hypothetical protein BZG36_00333 [Bifiguratus adelaidae]|uniref:RRM domain-containing protein n=1 Tax=Bifiguratus adelaidae TaxID=1938954 RepID=A0A261Y7V9_9FUNG|nr:hypothetical protein BZG36_00333 [Bifiguratus adelaidae]
MASIPPNQTIYVRNLPEKIQKEELRRSLYNLFSAYGRVLDVVAIKTIKGRGQAFIVFRELPSATAAMRGLNGFFFFEKPMSIEYAKSKSDAVAKLDGTYHNPEQVKRDKEAGSALLALGQKRTKDEAEAMDEDGNAKRGKHDEEMEENEQEPAKSNGMTNGVASDEVPNKILFLEGLVADATEEVLGYLFEQYPGFKEVRLVAGKPDLAFVEFETDVQSAVAKDALNGFKLTQENAMKVSFAKQ